MKNLLLFILAAVGFMVSAQSDEDSLNLLMTDIVIQENRLEVPFSQTSRFIEIIDQQEIKNLRANNINELLQTIAGVDMRQRGPHGVQGDLSIRGGTFEQALVLINGVKMIDVQTGHHMMNLPLTLSDIERIEVLKGPGARVFGQNAFAGAVNIITRQSSTPEANISAEYGTHDLLNINASVQLPLQDRIRQTLSYSHNRSDGYRYNTDYEIHNAFYQSDIDLHDNTALKIMGGYTARDFGANGFYGSTDFTEQYEETRTGFASVGVEQALDNWKLMGRLNWRQNKDNWQFDRENPTFFQNFHTTNNYSAELNSNFSHTLGSLGLGVEIQHFQINSNNLGRNRRTQSSLYAENRFELLDGQLDITPGVFVMDVTTQRQDSTERYITDADYDLQWYPGLDIGYRVSPSLRVFASLGRTSRVPSYTDLYYEDRGNVGNPNLGIESAWNYEGGLKYWSDRAFIQASYFRRESQDLIDWFRESVDDRWRPDNFGAATHQGLDLSLQYQFSNTLRKLTLGYVYINADFADNDFAFSRNVLENLRHQVTGQLNFGFIDDKLDVNILGKYNDRVSLDDYLTVDLAIAYDINPVSIYARATNVLDQDYRETNLVPMPGRWITFGIAYQFEKK